MFIPPLEQALLFLPLVFAVYLSYQILKITDLTAEGSFVLGACLFSIGIDAKLGIFISMLLAIFGGIFAGTITSSLQRILGFSDLIAGILAIFILQSLCLQSMGRPNMSLYDKPTLLSLAQKYSFTLEEPYIRLLIVFTLCIALFIFLLAVLSSRFGLILKAFGNNKTLLELFGKNEKLYCLLGLTLSNIFAALGGAITAQFQGFADIGMGTGVVLIALSSVIIGKRLSPLFFGRFSESVFIQLLSCFIGVFLYFLAVHGLIKAGVNPINLRMATAILVVIVLSFQGNQLQHKRSYK